MQNAEQTVDHSTQETEPLSHILLIAGTGSGVGKTSVSLALIRALVRAGFCVQPFKVGPDYLDPTHLTVAAGRTCYNLDTWMCGRDYVSSLVREKMTHGSIAVIEGAMGLFDGAKPDSSDGSAAEIAALLDVPVLLVCDTRGQARSFAATVKGFVEFEPSVRIAGVIANNCGSTHHGRLLAQALESAGLPPLVGAIEKGAFQRLKSRHLGLVPADAQTEVNRNLEALADVIESRVSIQSVLDLAQKEAFRPHSSTLTKSSKKSNHMKPVRKTVRLGIADDSAFCFYYPDNLEAFESAGFELVRFSPVKDERLPTRLDALYIGGGYPELAAEKLSNNLSIRVDIQSFCQSGRSVYAECGGLMYLSQGIVTTDGTAHPMVGVLPGICKMQTRLRALGYTEVRLTQSSLFGEAGTRLRGHRFHYSDYDTSGVEANGWTTVYQASSRRGASFTEGYQRKNVLISYVHLHLASHPSAVVCFLENCLAQKAAIAAL